MPRGRPKKEVLVEGPKHAAVSHAPDPGVKRQRSKRAIAQDLFLLSDEVPTRGRRPGRQRLDEPETDESEDFDSPPPLSTAATCYWCGERGGLDEEGLNRAVKIRRSLITGSSDSSSDEEISSPSGVSDDAWHECRLQLAEQHVAATKRGLEPLFACQGLTGCTATYHARCVIGALRSAGVIGALRESSSDFHRGLCPACVLRRASSGSLDEGRTAEWWRISLPSNTDPVEAARLQQISRGVAHGLSEQRQITFFQNCFQG